MKKQGHARQPSLFDRKASKDFGHVSMKKQGHLLIKPRVTHITCVDQDRVERCGEAQQNSAYKSKVEQINQPTK
jgi:hypothetical protein